jgi:hypothetical protein
LKKLLIEPPIKMNNYIVFALTANYEGGQIAEFIERLYLMESKSHLEAFDAVTIKAKTFDDDISEFLEEKREFIGITEVLPILEALENGNVIGHRIYLIDDELDPREKIMSREEFIEMCAEKELND